MAGAPSSAAKRQLIDMMTPLGQPDRVPNKLRICPKLDDGSLTIPRGSGVALARLPRRG